jgi:hypothetical protein
MSAAGVTCVAGGEASFTRLERFQREQQLHAALRAKRLFRWASSSLHVCAPARCALSHVHGWAGPVNG